MFGKFHRAVAYRKTKKKKNRQEWWESVPGFDASNLEMERHVLLGWDQFCLCLALEGSPARFQNRVPDIPPAHLEGVGIIKVQHTILKWELFHESK